VFAQFQDYLAPRLDVYEQAIYLYIFRSTIIEDKREATIGFKSARKKLAFGTGKAGTVPSEHTVYQKLRGLESKGCIKIVASERTGTRVRIVLPAEIPNLVPLVTDGDANGSAIDIENVDFFSIPENRKLILEREEWACFYCLAKLDENNQVIEHVVSRPEGNNSYRNVVAACRRCNNRKGDSLADGFLRSLYREGSLSGDELAARIISLNKLAGGLLKPRLS
jgi:hypothetical protein